MNAEKKLGLAFVGILSVAFCAVLTMRLLDANKAEQIDINVGPPVGSAPQFDPGNASGAKTDSSATATARPVAPAAPQPPETSRFASGGNAAAPKSGNYLPPMPKSPTPPAGNSPYGSDSRYASASTGATAPTAPTANPYGATSLGATPTSAPPMTNPYGSTASRYGTPAAPSAPATPSAPPSFGSATPTAAATLTPAATSSASPYGTPTAAPIAAASLPGTPSAAASPSMAASQTGSGDNPLRSSRSFDSAATGGSAVPPTSSTEPGFAASSGSTASLSSSGSRYAAPNIPSASTTPSLPASAPPSFAAAPSNSTATASMNTTATNTTSTGFASPSSSNSTREPRAFDASAVPSMPLSPSAAPSAPASVASTSTAPSYAAPSQAGSGFNGGFANTNALRSQSPTASPAGGFAANSGNSGTVGGSVAPVAATMPVAAPAVKNTPYVVQPDDTYWSISKKVYGDNNYYRALFAYNSDRYPHAEDVRAGSVLDVPPAEVLKQRYPELVSGAVGGDGRPTDASLAGSRSAAAAAQASYTVREGDTLFDIARRQLGKASRWNEIYELNRAALGENLENLRPGMQIQLPQ